MIRRDTIAKVNGTLLLFNVGTIAGKTSRTRSCDMEARAIWEPGRERSVAH
jgi:hypothetical protein